MSAAIKTETRSAHIWGALRANLTLFKKYEGADCQAISTKNRMTTPKELSQQPRNHHQTPLARTGR